MAAVSHIRSLRLESFSPRTSIPPGGVKEGEAARGGKEGERRKTGGEESVRRASGGHETFMSTTLT